MSENPIDHGGQTLDSREVAKLEQELHARIAELERHQAEDAKAICDVRPMDDEGYMRWMDRHSRVVARAAEIQRAREGT